MTISSGSTNPTFNGDDTGLFRTLPGSTTRFFPSSGNPFYNVGLPFEFAGQVFADSGLIVTFDRGGVFQTTAKIWANHPNSQVVFAGASRTYSVRGQTNEFPGTGSVKFSGTRLLFEDPSGSPSDDPQIAAGAQVVFNGTGTVEGNGLLSATSFNFAGTLALTLNGSTLRSTSTVENSVWNATVAR